MCAMMQHVIVPYFLFLCTLLSYWPIFHVPYFLGALFSKVPYFLVPNILVHNLLMPYLLVPHIPTTTTFTRGQERGARDNKANLSPG